MGKQITVDEKPRRDKALSEKKRQEGFLARQEEFAKKQSLLKFSLSSKSVSKNKLTFDSDSDSEVKVEKKQAKKKTKNLFDEDIDDVDEAETDFSNAIKRRKNQSEETMYLESRFQGDERFHMDERFENSESKKREKKKRKGEDEFQQEKTEADEEKEGDYRVLESILGKRVERGDSKKETDSRKKMQLGKMTRFDPSNPSHSQFEVDASESSSSSDNDAPQIEISADSGEEESENDERPAKSDAKKRTFVNQSFAENLRSKMKSESADGPKFSLLASLGLPENTDTSESTPAPSTSTSKLESPPKSSSKNEARKKHPEKQTQSFFFQPNDPRLIDGINKFCCTEKMEKVIQRWSISRPKMINSFKSQRKLALRYHDNKRNRRRKSAPGSGGQRLEDAHRLETAIKIIDE